ncbi:hypothetical protein V1509DRAFT_625980 [Lipomyces kononenkoae]
MSRYLQLIAHPQELRAVLQWAIWHEPLYTREPSKESDNLKRCYELFAYTSRSFTAVAPELRQAVMLFYIILRGLDTVEDDMTIPNPVKLPIPCSFHEVLTKEGWTFKDSTCIILSIDFSMRTPSYSNRIVLYEYEQRLFPNRIHPTR